MKFKKGDKVICTAPIGDLHINETYIVDECYFSKIDGIQHANEFVDVEGIEDTFFSFRFKLSAGDTDGYEQLVHELKKDPIRLNEPFINYVDEGLVSASKNDKEKIDLSLIPKISNIEHAKAFMVGEKKYGRYNYTKGHKASQLVAAAKRHLDAWFEREEHDPIDGQHHLGSVMACCSMILRQQELGTMKDDRFQ